MFVKTLLCLLTLVLILSAGEAVWAIDVECPIIADTLLAGHAEEHNTNCGGRTSLRVKGYQGIVIFRFDMSPVEGQRVEGGILTAYCKAVSGDAQGESFSESISTISSDWIEGTGDYTVDEDSATFDWPGKDIADEWAEDDNDGLGRNGVQINAEDVVNGFGDSIINSEGVWDFTVGEWTEIILDAELVQGLADGTQYGIAVCRNSTGVNLDLASREDAGGANAAKLVVKSGGGAVDAHDKLATTWGELKTY